MTQRTYTRQRNAHQMADHHPTVIEGNKHELEAKLRISAKLFYGATIWLI